MVALGLLLSRRNEAVSEGVKRGHGLPRIAHDISRSLSTGIAQSRVLSRSAGITRATEELEDIGVPVGSPGPLIASVRRDIDRAHVYSNNYATRWLKKAEGDTVAQAARLASKDTLGSLNRIAVTESAEAYGEGRQKAVDALPIYEGRPPGGAHVETTRSLLKVWDAQLDACPVCKMADGTIVGIKENFPQGVPGAVHPHCLCTWSALTFEERGEEGLIEPKAPAKVISLPRTEKPATAAVEPTKPAAAPKTKAEPKPKAPRAPRIPKDAQLRHLIDEGFTGGIPQSGLRPESFAHLRAGGAVHGGDVTLKIRADGGVQIVDGRHRITLARERGDAAIRARVLVEGARGGIKLDAKDIELKLGSALTNSEQRVVAAKRARLAKKLRKIQ